MFKKLSAFIFVFISFLSFSSVAFAAYSVFNINSYNFTSNGVADFTTANNYLTAGNITIVCFASSNTSSGQNCTTNFTATDAGSGNINLHVDWSGISGIDSFNGQAEYLYEGSNLNDSTWNVSTGTFVFNGSSATTTPTPTPTPTPVTFPRIFVANSTDDTVSVVNGDTDTVIDTIPVGHFPEAEAVSPDGSRLYAVNAGNGTVSVVDTISNTLIATINVGPGAGAINIAIDPTGTHLYVPRNGAVSVINTQTNSVESTIAVGSGQQHGTAISPDGSKLYVANASDNTVSVFNTQTNAVIATVSNVVQPFNLAVSPDGSKLYIANGLYGASPSVSVVDTATNSVVANIPVSNGIFGIAVSPDGNRVYVSNNNCCGNGPGTVTVINTNDNSIVAVVTVGDVPDLLSVSLDGSRVYVPNNWNTTMSVIDTATNTVIDTVVVGNSPFVSVVGRAPTVNHPPVVGQITVSPNPVQINTSVTASTTFTDPDAGETYTATANWGDTGHATDPCSVTPPSGSTPGSVSCLRSSGYLSPNVYPVTITVSDGSLTGTSPITYASVYDPTQSSIFTAGEHYSNPSTASPGTAGNVKFGLSYKYQGGMPTGVRQFSMDFTAANLHFNATNVNSLVVSNGMATLTGSGTKNGSSGYNFLVTGVDGGGIRIQITDSSNNVIYDTQPGDPITATPTTTVSGQVIVH